MKSHPYHRACHRPPVAAAAAVAAVGVEQSRASAHGLFAASFCVCSVGKTTCAEGRFCCSVEHGFKTRLQSLRSHIFITVWFLNIFLIVIIVHQCQGLFSHFSLVMTPDLYSPSRLVSYWLVIYVIYWIFYIEFVKLWKCIKTKRVCSSSDQGKDWFDVFFFACVKF